MKDSVLIINYCVQQGKISSLVDGKLNIIVHANVLKKISFDMNKHDRLYNLLKIHDEIVI